MPAETQTPANEALVQEKPLEGSLHSACSELTVGKLRDWLNDLRSQNWRDKDYSAAIVRDQDALARIMDHYDFCQRIEKITQNDQALRPLGGSV
jgi:hypothetical protein